MPEKYPREFAPWEFRNREHIKMLQLKIEIWKSTHKADRRSCAHVRGLPMKRRRKTYRGGKGARITPGKAFAPLAQAREEDPGERSGKE